MKDSIGDLFREGAESIRGCERLAYELFCEIEKHHGREQARRIFSMWGEAPAQRRLNEIKSWALLDRLDRMTPPNIAHLAREIAKENENLPKEARRGPGGSKIASTIEDYIRALVAKRKEKIKARTWDGPWPD